MLSRHLWTYGQLFIWLTGVTGQSTELAFMHGSPDILEGEGLMRSKGKLVELEKSNISSINICKKKFDVKVKT